MISDSNEHLQKQLEYTLLKPDCTAGEFQKCNLDLAPCDFWLFLKLRGYRYETIEEMKEAVTKVIDTLTQNLYRLWRGAEDVYCIGLVGIGKMRRNDDWVRVMLILWRYLLKK